MLGRSRPEFQETVGFFVNTVPLRANADGNPAFRDFLSQVQTTITEAIEHQEYPLPLMVRSLAQRRGTRHAPLIQTLIAWDRLFHVDLLRREVDGGEEHDPRMPVIEHVEVEQRGAGFDLVLFVIRDTGGVIHPRFQFNADLFDVATVRRLAECYCRLLSAAAADPDRPIDDIELSSPEELERTVVQFNRDATKTVADVPVHRLFAAAASVKPEHIAVAHEYRTTTYGDLNARADRLATLLREHGVGRNILVGLCIADPTAMIAAMLGVLKAGGAYVPLDPEQGVERLQLIVDDARCPVIVVDAGRRGVLPTSSAYVVDLDADAATLAAAPAAPPADETTFDDLAYVIYTSGSTGRPNGVEITHGNLAHSIAARISYYPHAPERFLMIMPFHFDGSVTAVYGTLARGGSLVVPPTDWRRRLDELPALIAAEGVTDVVCIPSLWNGILQGAEVEQLKSLRTVIVAGEACRRELLERHALLTPQARLFNEYGPTEAAVWCTVHETTPGATDESVPIGRPIADAQVYVLDEQMRPVPPGVVGELYIGGKGVADGCAVRLRSVFIRPCGAAVQDRRPCPPARRRVTRVRRPHRSTGQSVGLPRRAGGGRGGNFETRRSD
jgi:amino acid adenylation domain-containing protein